LGEKKGITGGERTRQWKRKKEQKEIMQVFVWGKYKRILKNLRRAGVKGGSPLIQFMKRGGGRGVDRRRRRRGTRTINVACCRPPCRESERNCELENVHEESKTARRGQRQ